MRLTPAPAENTRAPDPYRLLWIAVLGRAAKEALRGSGTAHRWLTTPSRDRELVVELAGYPPGYGDRLARELERRLAAAA